jgi:hypothetical protein
LNRAIEVLIIERILIVPDSFAWVGHFVAHNPDAILIRGGLNLGHYGTCIGPRANGSFHPYGATNGRKREIGRPAAHGELSIGSVIIHVAFAGMRLAPAVFVRSDVHCFSEICRALVERGVQVIGFNDNPMRYAIVHVTGVVIRIRRVSAGERIDPGARTQVWPCIETGRIGIGTSRAQIRAGSATAGVTAKTTGVVLQGQKRMFA